MLDINFFIKLHCRITGLSTFCASFSLVTSLSISPLQLLSSFSLSFRSILFLSFVDGFSTLVLCSFLQPSNFFPRYLFALMYYFSVDQNDIDSEQLFLRYRTKMGRKLRPEPEPRYFQLFLNWPDLRDY